jgi:hypothetical protein
MKNILAIGILAVCASGANAQQPDLKTAVETMNRMTEVDKRNVYQTYRDDEPTRVRLTFVFNKPVNMVLTLPHNRVGIVRALFGESDATYPRFLDFPLDSIDPSSVNTLLGGGVKMSDYNDFMLKHPNCSEDPLCVRDEDRFVDSLTKMMAVTFHTTDLKPVLEIGHYENQERCAEKDKVNDLCPMKPVVDKTLGRGVTILFDDADGAKRFASALAYAVKLEGGKPDLFPPQASR